MLARYAFDEIEKCGGFRTVAPLILRQKPIPTALTVGAFVLLGIEHDGAVAFAEDIETRSVRKIFGVLSAAVNRDEERKLLYVVLRGRRA